MVQWLRSLAFNVQMYLALAAIALAYAPFVLRDRARALDAVHLYCRWVRWSAAWMVGLRSEVRGTPPEGPCLIAAKHQSFFDIIMIVSAVPRPRFIMKKELLRAPFLGWYARKIGCVPVDRGRRGRAIRQMVADVEATSIGPGQLIIYPQGTRIAPGVAAPYKVGASVLYAELGQPCVPAATNVGVFWPRGGVMRRPGLAVVEFLDPIPPGRPAEPFRLDLAREVETASDRLMAEAGFRLPPE